MKLIICLVKIRGIGRAKPLGKATGLRAEWKRNLSSILGRRKRFLSSPQLRIMDPIQLAIQMDTGECFFCGNRAGTWSYTSTPLYIFLQVCQMNLSDHFTFPFVICVATEHRNVSFCKYDVVVSWFSSAPQTCWDSVSFIQWPLAST
jgi:hypothetical protein